MPKRISEREKAVPFSSTSIVPIRTSAASVIAPSPIWHTRFGAKRPASRGPASAATSIETDIGNSRFPVSNASKPSTTCR